MRVAAFLLLFAAQLAQAAEPTRPDHVVIVIEENKAYKQIIGNPEAPYINELAARGALFTNSYGVTHPSQPNYLALFAGSTFNVGNDYCPLELSGPNLASALMDKGLSFATYSEALPQAGDEDCYFAAYRRKHNPAANWKGLAQFNLPFTAFPTDYSHLPTVAFVVPDQLNDMHDGSIARGDAWLKQNIESYAQWAMKHNSVLIVTWDEDNGSDNNHIATILIGQHVRLGQYDQRIDHYNVLRTLEHLYALSSVGENTKARATMDVWM